MDYKANLKTAKQNSRSYFDKLLQQGKADVAIVRQILAEYDGKSTLAADKIEAILNQSDRVLLTIGSNNSTQIAQYKSTITQQAKIPKHKPSQSQDRER